MSELTRLRHLVALHATALNRRVQVEQELLDAASGKHPMPIADTLRGWAMRLAVPEDSELRQAMAAAAPPAAAPAGERVNHPRHYNLHPSGVECIDIVEHMTFNTGNAVKYLWRAGLKESSPELNDLRKAIWYIEREIERLQAANSPAVF